jgi:rhodanese-related sulfurtransferase
MNRKLVTPIILLILLSFLFSACAPAATQVVPAAVATATTAPLPTATAVPPTPEPTATPEPELDVQALWTDLVAGMPADKGYGTVPAAKLNEELVEKAPFLLDVREPAEVEKDGFIAGSVNIPVREVLANLDKLPAQDKPIVVLCASGHRGGFVISALRLLGYTNVRNLAGGLSAWKKAELAVETGKPADAKAGTAPQIADKALFNTLNEWLSNLPEGFYATKADKVNADLAESQPFVLDIRRANEYEENGRIAGAVNVPFEELFANLDKLPAKDTPIIVYCVSGHRGAVALMGLRLLGYEKAVNLGGGLNAWKAAKFPVEGWVDWMTVWGDELAALPDSFYAVSAADLNLALTEKAPFLLDVRETAEVEKDGYIAGAVNIPVRDLLKNLDKLPAQDQPIVIYCASGHRGGLALPALRMLGYTDVRNLGGGLGAWKKAEFPVEMGAPEAPAAGTAPTVNETVYKQLDAFLSGLPEGFFTVKAPDLNLALAETNSPFILDVREAGELEKDGYIEGAVNIPVRELFTRLSELPKDKAAPIVVLCKSGHRGAIAMMALRMNGYTDVRNLGGGMNAWVAAELPVVK